MLRIVVVVCAVFGFFSTHAISEPPVEFLYDSVFFTADEDRFGEPIFAGDGYTVYGPRARFTTGTGMFTPKSCVNGDQNGGNHVAVVLQRGHANILKSEIDSLATEIKSKIQQMCSSSPHGAKLDFFLEDLMFDRRGHLLTKDRHERRYENDAPVAQAVWYGSYWDLETLPSHYNEFVDIDRILSDHQNKRMIEETYAEYQREQSVQATQSDWTSIQAYKASLPAYIDVDGIRFTKSNLGGSNLYVHLMSSRSTVSAAAMYDFVDRNHADFPILISYWNRAAAGRSDDHGRCDGLNGLMERISFGMAAFERPVLMFDTNSGYFPDEAEYRSSALELSSSAFAGMGNDPDRGFSNGGFHAGVSSFYVGYAPDGQRHVMSMWGEENTLPMPLARALYDNSRFAQDIVDRNQGVLARGGVVHQRETSYSAFPEYELLKFYHSLLLFYADWGLSGRPSEDVFLPSRQGGDYENLYERQIALLGSSKTSCQGARQGVLSEARLDALVAEQKAREEEVWRRFMSRFEGPACEADTVLEVYGMADPCWGEPGR